MAHRHMRSTVTAAITVDLHPGDRSDDIRAASEQLAERGIRATLFVPSGMLNEAKHREAIREVVKDGHELGSHSHQHDYKEMFALIRGEARDLEFLRISKAIHEDVFGSAPTSFRSPCWCHLGAPATAALAELGYTADSSATPQRLSFLSSTPFENVWTFARRRPSYLAPSLLEVPTSCFLVPAGVPSFLILPSAASRALVKMLAIESALLPQRVLTLQLHASSFCPDSTRSYRNRRRLTLGDFFPRRVGGFAFKEHLRADDPAAHAALTTTILDSIRFSRFLTLSEVAAQHRKDITA